jgi:hypothetical protein
VGYTVLLADIINNTHVSPSHPHKILLNPPSYSYIQIYATSEEFEIKALGSAYPATSTTGGASPTNGTSTSSGSTSTSTKSGAEKVVMSVGTALAAVGMVFGLVVG